MASTSVFLRRRRARLAPWAAWPQRFRRRWRILRPWSPKAVVAVGGVIWETEDAPDLNVLLADQHAGGGVVAGICGGTLAPARAGLLDETAHTSNDVDFLRDNVKGYAGADLYRQSAVAVSDNHVVTAPGTAPVSFTAAIFESGGLGADTVAQFRAMLAAGHS